jgi:hypothetical protein
MSVGNKKYPNFQLRSRKGKVQCQVANLTWSIDKYEVIFNFDIDEHIILTIMDFYGNNLREQRSKLSLK